MGIVRNARIQIVSYICVARLHSLTHTFKLKILAAFDDRGARSEPCRPMHKLNVVAQTHLGTQTLTHIYPITPVPVIMRMLYVRHVSRSVAARIIIRGTYVPELYYFPQQHIHTQHALTHVRIIQLAHNPVRYLHINGTRTHTHRAIE